MTRIAFIGGGPKALYALRELAQQCSDPLARSLIVDVYDPYPPGAGRVWQAEQPRTLRLNAPASILDIGSPPNIETFAGWVARVEPALGGEPFPPRVVVGRYLHEQFIHLAQTAPFTIRHVPHEVSQLSRAGNRWRLGGPSGMEAYDEVVLATGHGLSGDTIGTRLAPECNDSALIGKYRSVDEEHIPPGNQVRVRGAALTAYDVVLLLTEGRDGVWEEIVSARGTRLRYIPSGREPALITLVSKSGLPMMPRTEFIPAAVRSCIDSHQHAVRAWGRSIRTPPVSAGANYNGLWRILLDCAAECGRLTGALATPMSLWRTAMTGRTEYVRRADLDLNSCTEAAVRTMRAGVDANRQIIPPNEQWLWGVVWAGLYPEVVQSVSRVRWSPRQTREFRLISRQLERLTFGPPEGTILKLIALFEAGVLAVEVAAESATEGSIVVNAVTPPPGVTDAPAPHGDALSVLMRGLIADGEITIRSGECGIFTDAEGTCLRANGDRNESLAALGRPTEGPTLGHDTLNSTLHGEHRRWARRIAKEVAPEQRREHR